MLVVWHVNVYYTLRLCLQTLILSGTFIHRYMALKKVPPHKFQLLGVAAVFIASTFEKTGAPKKASFPFMISQAYSRSENLAMEASILSRLHFDLTLPYAITFMLWVMMACYALNKSMREHDFEPDFCWIISGGQIHAPISTEYDWSGPLPSFRETMSSGSWIRCLTYN